MVLAQWAVVSAPLAATQKSNYASVNEQAGIFAGDGGFQVNVAGNTDLKGAVIASSDKAILEEKNTFATESLTTQNIYNQASYEGKSSSATVGAGANGGLPTLSGAGMGSVEGTAHSVTLSGIGVSTSTNTANALPRIFDAEKVQKDIAAQVAITQAFSQQAPVALNSYTKDKTAEINRQIKVAEAASDTATVNALKIEAKNWSENGSYRIAANIVIAAISGGASGATAAVTKESLSWAADQMRQAMIEDSKKFKGLCVSETDCISNMSGQSVGVNGDNTKVAGGRLVLSDWCKDGACEIDKTTISGYKENADGTVMFSPKNSNGDTLTIQQFVDLHPDWRSPLGGHQGGEGQMIVPGIQFDYATGSNWDKLAEAYAGTHDTFNSFIWYDNLGNGKDLDGSLIGAIGKITNMTNVSFATPFAASVLLPPEVWSSIFALIRSK